MPKNDNPQWQKGNTNWYLGEGCMFPYREIRDTIQIMENQGDKTMEIEMEAGIIDRFRGVRACRDCGPLV